MKIETAKVEIKIGDEVLVKRINLKGRIQDYFMTNGDAVLEIKLENGVIGYFFIYDIDRIITNSSIE